MSDEQLTKYLTDAQSITSGDTETFFAESEVGGALSGCSTTSASYTSGTTGPIIAIDTGPSVGDTINTKTPPEINGVEGYKSLDVILTAMDAAKQGKTLKIGV